MQRLPSLFALFAILMCAGFATATDHKDKKDDRRPEAKRPEHRDDHRRDDDDDDDDDREHRGDHRHPAPAPNWGRGPAPGPRPPAHPWAHGPHLAPTRCACDQGAPYKIQDCRPALTARGTTNFIRIFEAAAARGVENATIRAMNAASVAPTNNGQPCAENAKPTPAGPRR